MSALFILMAGAGAHASALALEAGGMLTLENGNRLSLEG